MRVPLMFLGTDSEVRSRMATLVPLLRSPASGEPAFGEMTEIEKHVPVLEAGSAFGELQPSPAILLRAMQRRLAGHHFRTYVMETFFQTMHPQSKLVEWYEWCFEEPWRFLFVLGDGAGRVFYGALTDLREHYLEAALQVALDFDKAGKRFVDVGIAEPYSGQPGPLERISRAADTLTSERALKANAAIRRHLAG